MRPINVLLAFLVSAAIFFGVFEAGLRLFPAFRPATTINRFDERLGWSKEPGARIERKTPEFEITFEINDQGLRDDPVAVPKPDGVYRVVCLGDSFVLGYTVDREDLFVDLLERGLNGGATKVEVVNAGTEGWSTDQEVAWFLEHGRAMDPDLVLLFPYENDVYWAGQESYYRFPKPRFTPAGTLEQRTLEDPGPQSVLSRLATVKALGALIAQLAPYGGPHTFEAHGQRLSSEFAVLLTEPPAFVADALARVGGAMKALSEAAGDAEVLVCPIPSESAIQPDARVAFAEADHAAGMGGLDEALWSPDRPVDAFLELARAAGLRTLDPRSALRTAYQADPSQPLYYDLEWHLTPHGNHVLATYLAEQLAGHVPGLGQPDLAALAEDPPPADEGGLPTWLLVYLGLWTALGTAYAVTYRGKEPVWRSYVGVGLMLASVFAIVLGFAWLLDQLPHAVRPYLTLAVIALILGFVVYKLGRRVGTVAELMRAFTLRGHWYLMPLVVVLLSIGSLLVVAASSPLVAPFIYTLF